MDSKNGSLKDFFDWQKISAASLGELHAKDGIGELKIQLNNVCPGLEWKAVWNTVIGHLDKLLEINVSEILLRAWKNYHDLSKYLDAQKYPPDRSYLAPLLEHSITSKHKPEIVIEIEPLFKKTIPFDISLKLSLKGFTLEIQAGKITKIHTGECRGNGTVQCMNVTLLEKTSGDITLPGVIDLGEGVPIDHE
jgi:hypothetical protein